MEVTNLTRGDLINLSGFGVDDDTLDKLSESDLKKIEELLDPSRDIGRTAGTTLLWTRPGEGQVFGFADCHEDVGFAGSRAQRVKDQFADANLEVKSMASGANETPDQRRKNRAITIVIPHVIDREVDLTDEFEGLMYVYGHERSSLVGD